MTAGSPNNLVITNVHVPVKQYWQGGAAGFPNQWDYTTANWQSNSPGGPLGAFSLGDYAFFQDGVVTPSVVLTNEAIEPVGVEFSASSTAYVLSGKGWLTGPMQMLCEGASKVIIANSGNSNSYSGGTILEGGPVQVGNGDTNGTRAGGTGGITNVLGFGSAATLTFNRTDTLTMSNLFSFGQNGATINQNGSGITVLAGNLTNVVCPVNVNNGTLRLATTTPVTNNFASLTVASGATLDLFNVMANLQQLPVTVSGAGVGGNGAIINSGTSATAASGVNQLTLAGDTTIGGSGRFGPSGMRTPPATIHQSARGAIPTASPRLAPTTSGFWGLRWIPP